MITAGVDVGTESAKAVILEDTGITGFAVLLQSGSEVHTAWNEALETALRRANRSRSDISRLLATGIGGKEVGCADDSVSDIAADARAAVWLFPGVRTAVDVGSEHARGILCEYSGKVKAYGKNDKCAAGAGAFVEAMARALEVPVEEMGALFRGSDQDIPLDSNCVVFAESEVISLIHARTPKPDIARAIADSIARRIAAMLNRVGLEKEVAFFGGVARNVGVVDRLKHHLGMEIFIPKEPQIVTALGAALLARD